MNKHKIINLDMDEIISNKDSRVLRINRWLHAKPVWQNAVVASAVWFWVITVLGDVYSLSMCALYKFNPEGDGPVWPRIYLLALIIMICTFMFPISFTGWGIHHIYKNYKQRSSFFIQIAQYIGWFVALVVLVILPFVFFIIGDMGFTISLVPFLTPVCALLWLRWAIFVTNKFSQEKRVLVLCGLVLLSLSLRYIDLNSRKPFLRDLGRITIGMTGHEVKVIMGKYDDQVTHHVPLTYEYLESDFSGQAMYRHTDEGWGNADFGFVKFQNGRVVGVEFSHD